MLVCIVQITFRRGFPVLNQGYSTPDIAAYDNTAFTGISTSPAAAAGSPTSNGGQQQQNQHEMQACRRSSHVVKVDLRPNASNDFAKLANFGHDSQRWLKSKIF